MKRIRGLQQGSPGLPDVLPFTLIPLTLSIVNVYPTRCALQMKQFRKRGPDNAIAMVSESQAKIDIIKSDAQMYVVESADFEEYRTPDCGAGTCHRRKCARQRQLPEVA